MRRDLADTVCRGRSARNKPYRLDHRSASPPRAQQAENLAFASPEPGRGPFVPYWRNDRFRRLEQSIVTKVPSYGFGRSKRVIELSPGEQQRFAITIARLRQRPIILVDEPTTSLNPESYEWVVRELIDRTASADTTAVIVTHDPRLLADINGVICELTRDEQRSSVVAAETEGRGQ